MKKRHPPSLKRQVERIKKRNNIIFFSVVFCLFLYLAGAIVFGERGLLKYIKLQKTKAQLKTEITSLEAENNRLRAEVKALKEDPYYIEKHAREEFGLARPGEYIFQFQQDTD